MSRKDYELIARAVSAAKEAERGGDYPPDYEDGVRAVAEELAYRLQDDNPNFNFLRFLAACGVSG